MKNLTLSFSLALSFLLLFSCNESPSEPKETPVKPPQEIISTKQAQLLFDNYSNKRVPLIQKYEDSINPEKQFDVARYGYYDYKTLKTYMAFIEQEAKKANVDIATVRFYFSNYSDDPKVKHPGQNTFFMIPTTVVDGKDYGFSVLSDGQGNYKAGLLKNNFIIKQNQPIGQTTGERTKTFASFAPVLPYFYQDTTSLIMNESNIVPPPY